MRSEKNRIRMKICPTCITGGGVGGILPHFFLLIVTLWPFWLKMNTLCAMITMLAVVAFGAVELCDVQWMAAIQQEGKGELRDAAMLLASAGRRRTTAWTEQVPLSHGPMYEVALLRA